MILRKLGLLARLMKPADDDGGDLPGVHGSSTDLEIPEGADRGDSFTPTGDDDDHAKLREKIAERDANKGGEKTTDKSGEKPGEKADDKSGEKSEKTDDKPDDKPKKGVIPVERHESILRREREARERVEAQLKQFQGSEKVAKTNTELTKLEDKLTELDTAYTKAVADGDTKRAAELMREIRKTDREVVETRAEFRIEAVRTQAVEMARYEAVVERIEEAYPQLNPESDEYDKDLDEDVADLMETYQRRGLPPAKALQRAVERLVKPATAKQESATSTTPRVSDEDTAAAAEKLAKERRETAVKAAADANKRQPPETDKVGQNSDKMGGGLNARDVMKLDQDAFAKLSEKDLAKLRGDEL